MYDKYEHPGGKLRRLGPKTCTESELLAIVLHTGSKGRTALDIAHDIIDEFGTFYDLQGKTLNDVMEIKGVGAVKATQIAAVFELCQRVITEKGRR